MAMTENIPLNSASGTADCASVSATWPNRGLVPAAERALAEAKARHAEIDRRSAERPTELHGRDGPDPTRYGDWEVNGIASDF